MNGNPPASLSPEKVDCACVHDDAKMCIAIRYNRAYDLGESDDHVLDDEECECCCHIPDQDEPEEWI